MVKKENQAKSKEAYNWVIILRKDTIILSREIILTLKNKTQLFLSYMTL